MEDTKTICPYRLFRKAGMNAFVSAMCDVQLVFIIFWQLSKSKSTNFRLIDTPALLIRMSSESNVLAYFVASLYTIAGSLKSISHISTSPFLSLHSYLTLSNSLFRLAAMITFLAPKSNIYFVISSPIPELAPVIITVLPR